MLTTLMVVVVVGVIGILRQPRLGVLGSTVKAVEGDTKVLECPTTSGVVEWRKNGRDPPSPLIGAYQQSNGASTSWSPWDNGDVSIAQHGHLNKLTIKLKRSRDDGITIYCAEAGISRKAVKIFNIEVNMPVIVKGASASITQPTNSNHAHAMLQNNVRRADAQASADTLQCDFTQGLCGWTQDTADDFDWTRHSGTPPSGSTGPTSGYGGSGYYMYTEASTTSTGQKARLRSPTVVATGNEFELTFYYSMYGTNMGTLRVYRRLTGAGNETQLGETLTVTNSRAWVPHSVFFTCDTQCQIIFEGTRGNDWSSDIAIDEVKVYALEKHEHIYNTNSNSSLSKGETRYCNFDSGVCSNMWTVDTTAEMQWVLHRGVSQTPETGPASAYGGNGSYLLLDASHRHHRSGETARLVSDVISSANVNLTFWYSMYGHDVGALRVYKTYGSDRSMVWERVGDQGTRDWLRGVVDMTCTRTCVVTIEAEKGVFYHGDIGVDEVMLEIRHDVRLALSQTQQAREECDFDTDACGWTQAPGASVVWELWTGASPKSNTGPMGDYTTGRGQYALFQDSRTRANISAVITSHVIRRPFRRTMTMAYHMLQYNNQTSRLSVYMRLVATGVRSLVWNKSPAEGVLKWQTDSLNLTSDQPYVIEIEAVGGAGGYGDIGVDNVGISSGMLPAVANCDFQYDFCNWTQMKDDDFDWLLNSGETSTTRTGPRGASYYAYAESSYPRVSGHVAVMESPTIGPLGNQSICVRFIYNMYGAQVGRLELEQVSSTGNGTKVLWEKSGNQGQRWWAGHMTVAFSGNDEFRFQFKATRKNGLRGDIAIRDVKTELNACKEDAPYDCDFEIDMCEWRPSTSGGSGNWSFSLETANTNSDAAPPADHTTGSPHGGYMYATSRITQATIQTTVATTRVLCVEFWYFCYGNEITGKLDFWTRPNDGSRETIKWSFVNESVAWQRGKVTVQSNLKYTMGFGAKAADGFAAIDDITVTYGACD